eukprot:CAMPEP_0119043644 /NCGR_PEP_ID=MMETSP1177-20130426/24396_1 /TAXON_ID=2985 /ORGANISM="Ochromonas sp, Strain CCMP1899" /LENGTH=473 /DNA_ID=CAMNT_0007012211 /DNA_START=376 /DNA_END=1797 /DNA_ORIENTATION=-
MGASVSIDGTVTTGLILQREIKLFQDSRDGIDVEVGEILEGFVERVREDGKIDVSIRPLGVSRIVVVKQLVLDAIEGSPVGSIPVGDKSTPVEIASYFHGISKKDFKNAIGSLYREGLVSPGGLITSSVAEEDVNTSRIQAEATKKSTAAIKKPSVLPSERDSSRSIFIGNLPNKVTREDVLQLVIKKLGKDVVTDLRLSLDENKRPRGFAYLELKSGDMVENAIDVMDGQELGGRTLRSDYADPSRKQNIKTSVDAPEGNGGAWQSGYTRGTVLGAGAEKAKVALSSSAGTSNAVREKVVMVRDESEEDEEAAEEEKIVQKEGYRVWTPKVVAGAKPTTDRAPVDAGNEKSKSWVTEAERNLRFKKTTSPSSYANYGGENGSRKGAKPSATLFIGNLAFEVDEKMLHFEVEKFSGPGTVASVRFPEDRATGAKKGFAYVDIYKTTDAKKIFENMHGSEILGRSVNIDDATRK